MIPDFSFWPRIQASVLYELMIMGSVRRQVVYVVNIMTAKSRPIPYEVRFELQYITKPVAVAEIHLLLNRG